MADSATVTEPILPIQGAAGTLDIKAELLAGQAPFAQAELQQMEKELQIRTEERENYKNRLQAVESELLDLKAFRLAKDDPHAGDVVNTADNLMARLKQDNTELRSALNKARELLKDKSNLCQNQERQNQALINQVVSLKEVVAITKDLLNIRNLEVQHLQTDIENMEEKITAERTRHNNIISKMDEAVKLNAELKREYETQLQIFQDLKIKYEEKVILLTKENKKLEQKANFGITADQQNNEESPQVTNDAKQQLERKPSEDNNFDTNNDDFVDANEDIGN